MDRKTYEYISQQTNDPIIERKVCKRTGKDFPIFQWDIDLLKKLSPKIWWKVYDLPTPTLSFKAREQRRLMRRNDRKLYKSKCKVTWDTLITFYHPELEKNIVEATERFNSVDNTDLWEDFDFSKTFGQQISELISNTKKQHSLIVWMMENSKYTHNVGDLKDSYMVFDGGMWEDVLYWIRVGFIKRVVDCFEILRSENIYESVSIHNSNNIFYSQDCNDCSYGAFLYNCIWSNNCICCSNLVNKDYYIFNQKVTKEEFDKVWSLVFDGTWKWIIEMKEKYTKLLSTTIRKAINTTNCENSLGHNIKNSKNIFCCYEATSIENCRYSNRIDGYSNSSNDMDINSWWWNMSNCYELNCCGSDEHTSTYNCHFSSYLFWWVSNTQYSVNIPRNSEYLFWCSDITSKKYCILNKQYTKEEYEKKIPKIIDYMIATWERWEFIDPKYSPFPYNDTIANDYYPVKQLQYPDWKIEILDPQWTWIIFIHEPHKIISKATLDLWWESKIETKRRMKDDDVTVPNWLQSILAQDLPDDINKIENSILNKAIICSQSWRPFRVVGKELEFYRKHWLPMCKLHPDVRHLNRLKKITQLNLYKINCDKCSRESLSVYPDSREFSVYCENCYNKEIY